MRPPTIPINAYARTPVITTQLDWRMGRLLLRTATSLRAYHLPEPSRGTERLGCERAHRDAAGRLPPVLVCRRGQARSPAKATESSFSQVCSACGRRSGFSGGCALFPSFLFFSFLFFLIFFFLADCLETFAWASTVGGFVCCLVVPPHE